MKPTSARQRNDSSKTSVIRARCDDDLKTLVDRAALMLGLDEADVIRMGTRDFAQRVVFQRAQLPVLAA